MTLKTILQIYFGFNMFFSGYYVASNIDWATDYYRRIKLYVLTFGLLTFGCLYFFLQLIMVIFTIIYQTLNVQLQLGFWLSFLFTKKFSNLPKERLLEINSMAEEKKLSKKLKDKTYVYGVKKLNKRANRL